MFPSRKFKAFACPYLPHCPRPEDLCLFNHSPAPSPVPASAASGTATARPTVRRRPPPLAPPAQVKTNGTVGQRVSQLPPQPLKRPASASSSDAVPPLPAKRRNIDSTSRPTYVPASTAVAAQKIHFPSPPTSGPPGPPKVPSTLHERMVSPVHAKRATGDSHPPPVATALGDNDAFAKAWVSAHASLADSQKGHGGLVALKALAEESAPLAQDETNLYADEAAAAPPSHSAPAPAPASPSVGSFAARAAGYVSPTAIAALARPPAHRSMVGLARTNTAAPAPAHPSRVPASASAIIREGEPPILKPNLNCKVPIKIRQKVVEAFYKEFRRIYAPFLAKRPTAAHQHAVKQETKLLGESTHLGYQGHALAIIKRLQARPLATSDKDVGIDGVYKPIAPPLSTEISEAEKSSINALVCSEETLVALGYPFPSETAEETAVEEEEAGDSPAECNRCSQRFIPTFPLDPAETIACRFHWGYARTVMHLGDKQRIWSCCQKPVLDEGCTEGPHVFKEEETALLHKRIPFKRFPPSSPSSPFMVGLDCEMSYTTGGMELTRVTVLPYIAAPTTNTDPRPRPPPLLDELVRTSWPVLDLNTRWSGIESLESAKYDINSIRDRLSQLIGSDTIIVGHGLENDLKAMRMFHTRVIDTAHLFPHPRGLPLRHPLRLLAQKVLGRFIQVQGGKLGHDSAEDAEACLDLVRTCIQKGGTVRF